MAGSTVKQTIAPGSTDVLAEPLGKGFSLASDHSVRVPLDAGPGSDVYELDDDEPMAEEDWLLFRDEITKPSKTSTSTTESLTQAFSTMRSSSPIPEDAPLDDDEEEDDTTMHTGPSAHAAETSAESVPGSSEQARKGRRPEREGARVSGRVHSFDELDSVRTTPYKLSLASLTFDRSSPSMPLLKHSKQLRKLGTSWTATVLRNSNNYSPNLRLARQLSSYSLRQPGPGSCAPLKAILPFK